RRGRGALAVLHAANSAPRGPSAARASMTGSQPAVPASPGRARSSTQRPGARRTATAALGTPPAARRHAAAGPESPGTISAPRASVVRPAGALRTSGIRAAASCIRSRVSYSQRSVASPAAPRTSANTATPNSAATMPYGPKLWRQGRSGRAHQRRSGVVDLEPSREPRQLLERPGPDEQLRQVVPGAASAGRCGGHDREVRGGGSGVTRREGALVASALAPGEDER